MSRFDPIRLVRMVKQIGELATPFRLAHQICFTHEQSSWGSGLNDIVHLSYPICFTIGQAAC
jgi:hypothetical protein